MSNKAGTPRTDAIALSVETFFGEPIVKMTAPGGRGRGSFRVYFPDRTIIVTDRGDVRRMSYEMFVLERLAPVSDDVPRVLGTCDGLLFQSDAGTARLNHLIHTLAPAARPALAREAIARIFAIQRAARRTDLAEVMPVIGNTRAWREMLVGGVARLARRLCIAAPVFDAGALSDAINVAPRQFVKWDCRAGNAALDDAGRLRWFDFEYCGICQGAEDFAWLIGDETWPIGPAEMLDMVRDELTGDDTPDTDAYMAYLSRFTVLHIVHRLSLIIHQAHSYGWKSPTEALKYDKIGVDPHLGERLAQTGLHLARADALTAPLGTVFSAAARAFRDVRRAPAPQQAAAPAGHPASRAPLAPPTPGAP